MIEANAPQRRNNRLRATRTVFGLLCLFLLVSVSAFAIHTPRAVDELRQALAAAKQMHFCHNNWHIRPCTSEPESEQIVFCHNNYHTNGCTERYTAPPPAPPPPPGRRFGGGGSSMPTSGPMPCVTPVMIARNPACASATFPESASTIEFCTDIECWKRTLTQRTPPACMPCTTWGLSFVNSASGVPWALRAPPCCEIGTTGTGRANSAVVLQLEHHQVCPSSVHGLRLSSHPQSRSDTPAVPATALTHSAPRLSQDAAEGLSWNSELRKG